MMNSKRLNARRIYLGDYLFNSIQREFYLNIIAGTSDFTSNALIILHSQGKSENNIHRFYGIGRSIIERYMEYNTEKSKFELEFNNE